VLKSRRVWRVNERIVAGCLSDVPPGGPRLPGLLLASWGRNAPILRLGAIARVGEGTGADARLVDAPSADAAVCKEHDRGKRGILGCVAWCELMRS